MTALKYLLRLLRVLYQGHRLMTKGIGLLIKDLEKEINDMGTD